MKKIFYISGSVAMLIIASVLGYYFIVLIPKINNAKLEQEQQAHEQSTTIEKEKLKQQCLAIKYGDNSSISAYQKFEKSHLECN